eukprot:3890756-Pyramimonas_sp.AAC.1
MAPEGAPPKVPVAQLACVCPTWHSVRWPQRELHCTEGLSGAARMHPPHPANHAVAPEGAPHEVPVAQFACAPPT